MRRARSLLITVCFLLAGFPGTVISQETPPANPYLVECSFPPYLLEHRKLFSAKSGIYKAGPYPVWTVHTPGGWIGNVTFIEGDATNLLPTEPVEKATRFVELMGGRDRVLAAAEEAFQSGDAQFAAELPQGSVPENAVAVVRLSAASLNQVNRGESSFRDVAQIEGDAEWPDRLIAFLDRELPAIYLND